MMNENETIIWVRFSREMGEEVHKVSLAYLSSSSKGLHFVSIVLHELMGRHTSVHITCTDHSKRKSVRFGLLQALLFDDFFQRFLLFLGRRRRSIFQTMFSTHFSVYITVFLIFICGFVVARAPFFRR